jgi:hypothetical protein
MNYLQFSTIRGLEFATRLALEPPQKKSQQMSEGATNLYVSMIICLKRDLDV